MHHRLPLTVGLVALVSVASLVSAVPYMHSGCCSASYNNEIYYTLGLRHQIDPSLAYREFCNFPENTICAAAGTCQEKTCALEQACGSSTSQSCYCDAACVGAGDCCGDACETCGHCSSREAQRTGRDPTPPLSREEIEEMVLNSHRESAMIHQERLRLGDEYQPSAEPRTFSNGVLWSQMREWRFMERLGRPGDSSVTLRCFGSPGTLIRICGDFELMPNGALVPILVDAWGYSHEIPWQNVEVHAPYPHQAGLCESYLTFEVPDIWPGAYTLAVQSRSSTCKNYYPKNNPGTSLTNTLKCRSNVIRFYVVSKAYDDPDQSAFLQHFKQKTQYVQDDGSVGPTIYDDNYQIIKGNFASSSLSFGDQINAGLVYTMCINVGIAPPVTCNVEEMCGSSNPTDCGCNPYTSNSPCPCDEDKFVPFFDVELYKLDPRMPVDDELHIFGCNAIGEHTISHPDNNDITFQTRLSPTVQQYTQGQYDYYGFTWRYMPGKNKGKDARPRWYDLRTIVGNVAISNLCSEWLISRRTRHDGAPLGFSMIQQTPSADVLANERGSLNIWGPGNNPFCKSPYGRSNPAPSEPYPTEFLVAGQQSNRDSRGERANNWDSYGDSGATYTTTRRYRSG